MNDVLRLRVKRELQEQLDKIWMPSFDAGADSYTSYYLNVYPTPLDELDDYGAPIAARRDYDPWPLSEELRPACDLNDWLARFEELVTKFAKTHRAGGYVRYSGDKRYTFWWHEKGGRLIVKISRRPKKRLHEISPRRRRSNEPVETTTWALIPESVPWSPIATSRLFYYIRPQVELLAEKLRGRGACAMCGTWFERPAGSRQQYCGPRCSSRLRKKRWHGAKTADTLTAKLKEERLKREAESAALIQRNEELRAASKRAAKARHARKHRRGLKLERMLREREKAFKEAGGKD